MPRNASGTYTLPLPPVIPNTIIESVWANTSLDDLANSLTDSLDRYGRGGMVAPFRIVDGTVSAPGLSFVAETNTGWYRVGTGQAAFAVLGVKAMGWTTLGVDVPGTLSVTGAVTFSGSINTGGLLKAGAGILVVGSQPFVAFDATGPGTEAYIQLDTVTHDLSFRSNNGAGFQTWHNGAGGVERMRLDTSGNLYLGTTTAASVGSTAMSINGSAAASLDLRVADMKLGQWFANGTAVLFETTANLPLLFRTNSTEKIRVSASAVPSVGIGAIPAPWSQYVNLQLAASGGTCLWGDGLTSLLTSNASFNGTWLRTTSSPVMGYVQTAGSHSWSSDAGGTAGAAFSPTERMRLDVNGNLGIAGQSVGNRLEVFGDIQIQPGQNLRLGFNSSEAIVELLAGSHNMRIGELNGAGIVTFFSAGAERLRLDANGNLGLGCTPVDWHAGYKVMQLGFAGGGAVWGPSADANSVFMSANLSFVGFFQRTTANPTTAYSQASGIHSWFTDPAGAAGAAVTMSPRMTIDTFGNLLPILNTTAPTLTVNNQMVFSLTSDTSLRVSVRGSDGVTRVANLTLA